MSGAPAMTEERVYTTKEVADIIRVHPKTVTRLIQRGDLEAFTISDEYRITQSSLDRFMRGERPAKKKDSQDA